MNKLRDASTELASRLEGRMRLQYTERCPSTSSLLRELHATGGLELPTLICTDDQFEGRGTRGRGWEMQPGHDLAFSIGIPLADGLRPSPRLPIALAVIVAQGLANRIREQWRAARLFRQPDGPLDAGPAPGGEHVINAINAARDELAGRVCALKWPNDLLLAQRGVDGELEYRKCGGILTELLPGALLVGIGINVNSRAVQFPADLRDRLCTLRDCGGMELDREALFGGLVLRLFGHLVHNGLLSGFSAADESGIDALAAAWKAMDRTAGSRWIWQHEGKRIPVVATGVDFRSGEILLEDADGHGYRTDSYSGLESE